MKKLFKPKSIFTIIGSIFIGDYITKMIPWLPANVSLFLGIICFAIVIYFYLSRKDKGFQENLFSDEFKDINIKKLSIWCNGWGKMYDHLSKIVLYAYPPQSELRYELYFEFDVFSKEGEKQSGVFNEGTWDHQYFPVHNNIEKFKNVYNEKPKDSNYINEWNFFCNARDSDKEIPESVPSIEIYRRQKRKNP